MNQQVALLSDGGDTVRDLQLYLNPEPEHVLASCIEESEARSKLLKGLHEFEHYIAVNKPFFPNYGDRYRISRYSCIT